MTDPATIAVGDEVDLNGDGIIDGMAVDSNGDGIADGVDTNGDGIADQPLPSTGTDADGADPSDGADPADGPDLSDGTDSLDGSDGSEAGGLPCDVQKAVEEKCGLCHGATPAFSAPMSLVSYADFMAPARSDPSKSVYELVKDRVNHAEPALRMPPVAQPALEATELSALNAWIDSGAAENTASCEPISGDGGDSDGTDGAPCTGPDCPCDGPDCVVDTTGLECYKLTAHAPGDKNAKF